MRYITILTLSILLAAPVSAHVISLPDSDTTPADGRAYAWERFKEESRLFVTFGEARTELLLRNAEERLSEIHVLAEAGKTEALAKAMKEYEKAALRAARRAGSGFKTAAGLRKRVAEEISRHLVVLEELRDQLPTEARSGISNARESAAKGLETALRVLAKKDPETAALVYTDALMARLLRARERAEAGYADAALEAVTEFNRLEPLGDDIADWAKKRKAERAVGDVFAEVRLSHVRRLEEISRSIPEEARSGLQQVLDRARVLEERLPAQFRNNPFAPNIAQ